MAQTGKVKVTKQEILGLIGKGGKKHANDTDKKALKEFLDAGKDGTFFIKKIMDEVIFRKDKKGWVNHLVLTKKI